MQSLDALYDLLVSSLNVVQPRRGARPRQRSARARIDRRRRRLFTPPDWLDREDELLAPYAMRTRHSRGRRHPEPPHPFRTLYQRDRDRIVHSHRLPPADATRRRCSSRQTNDHHRTRLTHTLEVAQISRTIARQLGLQRGPDRGHRPVARPRPSAVRPRRRERPSTSACATTAASSTTATACASSRCWSIATPTSRA